MVKRIRRCSACDRELLNSKEREKGTCSYCNQKNPKLGLSKIAEVHSTGGKKDDRHGTTSNFLIGGKE